MSLTLKKEACDYPEDYFLNKGDTAYSSWWLQECNVDSLCYWNGWCHAWSWEEDSNAITNQLKINGIASLQDEFKTIGSLFYERIDLNNSNRLMRANRSMPDYGTPYSKLFRKAPIKKRPFENYSGGLTKEREIDLWSNQIKASGIINDGKWMLVWMLDPYCRFFVIKLL